MITNKEIRKQAIKDFYGRYVPNAQILKQYFTKRNKPKLTEEQKNDLWCIRINLEDKTYRESIASELTSNSL